jgi:hypothetical protein
MVLRYHLHTLQPFLMIWSINNAPISGMVNMDNIYSDTSY